MQLTVCTQSVHDRSDLFQKSIVLCRRLLAKQLSPRTIETLSEIVTCTNAISEKEGINPQGYMLMPNNSKTENVNFLNSRPPRVNNSQLDIYLLRSNKITILSISSKVLSTIQLLCNKQQLDV
ncbi:hypothetical protein FGO68_gene3092 [Halteria grandinella]|uniref:Uncharacterized protein n=1 Tax=Halteria grandinella TaxID=5974 RepID=A0A8J8P546_HALGN|nr:hypothetical protein FGO68_gene3092 [Halteria grandinella]